MLRSACPELSDGKPPGRVIGEKIGLICLVVLTKQRLKHSVPFV